MNAPLVKRISIVFLAAFALAFAGCSSRPSAPAAPPVVTGLRVVQAELQQIPSAADAVGTVHASESAILSAQTTGRITAVLVKEGDQVRAGQLLVKLDDAQPQAEAERAQAAEAGTEHQVEVAQSESALANSTLARYKLLRERKSISPQEYDEVERRAQVAAAQLEAARAQLSSAHDSVTSARTVAGYSRLTAPFAGIVTARLMDPGSLAAPGAPLLEIEKAGTLQLDVTVDESLLSAVHQGMPLHVNIAAASAQPLAGRIADIVPAANPSSHSFLVKIDLPSSRNLRSGMYGTAAIGTATRAAILAPRSAVILRGSLPCAYVLDSNGIAQLRYLTLGGVHGDQVEVLSGISSGEKLVDAPLDRDLAGKRIEVEP